MSATVLIDPRLCTYTSVIIACSAHNGHIRWVITLKEDTVNFGGDQWYLYDNVVFSIGKPLTIKMRDGQRLRFERTDTFIYDPIGV